MNRMSPQQVANSARAEAAFKPATPKTPMLTEHAMEKQAFDENRERLRRERLAREAASNLPI